MLGLVDALQLYTFMLALRHLDVALAVFLSYMSPIYIALVAPRLLKQRTEPVVIAALVLAVSGIVVMLAPGLMDPALRVSALGVALGLLSGVLLAVFFLVAKTLSSDVDGSTMLISNGVIVTVVMLPFGLVQWAGAGFPFVLTDLWAVLGLAVFSTALGGTIFLHGMRYIPVQHTSIVGLLEPASAPVFALVFLAERPSLWTLLGGALILCGAVLVVLFGATEEGLAGSPEEAVGEAGPRREAPPGQPLEADRAAPPGLDILAAAGRAALPRAYARGMPMRGVSDTLSGGPQARRGAVVVPGRAGSGGSPA